MKLVPVPYGRYGNERETSTPRPPRYIVVRAIWKVGALLLGEETNLKTRDSAAQRALEDSAMLPGCWGRKVMHEQSFHSQK